MEPMNVALSHAKVRVTTHLSSPVFVAGEEITGKMELDCRTDKGLGISTMMVELVAVQELTSRDHSATSTFMAAKRLFQGPGLPPSNAVFAHPQPGVAPLPQHFHQARKGSTTFFFNFPLPQSSPNSIDFGNGLARVFYEIRATVNIFWRGERTTVRNKKEVAVVECLLESRIPREPFTMVAEGGKMVVQAQVVGGIGTTGQPACVELQIKNHSQKKTTSLNLTLTRTLHLSGIGDFGNKFQLTDTVVTVPFRGAEYTISPGVEGVANLVFDIPKNARGVKGGTRERTDDGDHKHIEALFDVRTSITVVLGMGVGSKDIKIEVPIVILHPSAVPEAWNDPYAAMNAIPQEFVYGALEPPRLPYALPAANSSGSSSPVYPQGPLQYQHTPTPPNSFGNIPPTSPIPMYPNYYTPPMQPYFDPLSAGPAYYFPPPPMGVDPFAAAGGLPMAHHSFGDINTSFSMPNLPPAPAVANDGTVVPAEGHTEEGKGERASRISLHLRVSSRNRSASPTSHRYRITGAAPAEDPDLSTSLQMSPPPLDVPVISTTAATIKQSSPEIRSPRPMPSPKASFYGAPLPAFGQSGRVAALEMMAAEEENNERKARVTTLEAPNRVDSPTSPIKASPEQELDAAELIEILDKTLPTPPVPSKRRLSEPPRAANPDLFTVFSASKVDKPPESPQSPKTNLQKEAKETESPPIVTLANIGKRGRASTENIRSIAISAEAGQKGVISTLKPPKDQVNSASKTKQPIGLDALERRLLKEVGTRKQPDTVLHQLREMETATAGAIQQKAAAKKTLGVEPHRRPADGSVAATFTPSEDKDAAIHVLLNRKRRKTFDQEPLPHEDPSRDLLSQGALSKQEEEALKLRKAAKGRVAAWLGHAQVANPPPPSETRIVEQAMLENASATPLTTTEKTEAAPLPEKKVQDATVEQSESDATTKQHVDPSKIQLPGRRSSGFLPISRFNVQPSPVVAQVQTALEKALAQPSNDRAKAALLPFNRTNYGNYDVRSARGGRGGVVTSVATIWAEKTKADASSPPPSDKDRVPLPASKKEALANLRLRSPPLEDSPQSQPQNMAQKLPKPHVAKAVPPLESIKETETASATSTPTPTPWFKVAITAARSAPGYLGIKSTSVPAKLSSSIATPMLSSTASLARPPRQPQSEYPPKPHNPLPPVSSDANKRRVNGVKAAIPISATIPTGLTGPTSPISPSDSAPAGLTTTAALSPTSQRQDPNKATPRMVPTVSIGQGKLKDLIAKYQGAGAKAN